MKIHECPNLKDYLQASKVINRQYPQHQRIYSKVTKIKDMVTASFKMPCNGLTEVTSVQCAAMVQSIPVQTPSCSQPIDTTYLCDGQGQPPILLLHGFDSSVLEFRRLLPLLAQQTQTWAVDLLGFGFTARPDGLEISTTTIRQHLYAFWQLLIQRPVVLVGASMGGAAALEFTLSHPEAVQKLVLLDSAGYSSGPAIGQLLIDPLGYWVTERFLRRPKVRQQISAKAYHNPAFASTDAQCCAALHLDCPNWSKALISFTRSGGYRSYRDRLSQIQIPTRILWGTSDRILGTQDAERFHRAIPGSQLVWVPECGHVPHLEQPQFTAAQILDFLG
jgi:pimeloyl-ACP methyl ester carboxylesterase